MSNPRIDLTGLRIGKLKVLKNNGIVKGRFVWLCKCDCGNTIVVRYSGLKRGNCGCVQEEHVKKNIVHGMSTTKTYHSWHCMMQRCYNENHVRYGNYGARGIKVCDRWKDFNLFLDDMGNRPEGMTLDRIDNNKNYSKYNCRWSTNKEQQNNRGNNRLITYNNKTHNLSQWAEKFNISPSSLYNRLFNYNWTIERAFTTSVRFKSKNNCNHKSN